MRAWNKVFRVLIDVTHTETRALWGSLKKQLQPYEKLVRLLVPMLNELYNTWFRSLPDGNLKT